MRLRWLQRVWMHLGRQVITQARLFTTYEQDRSELRAAVARLIEPLA